MPGLSVHVRMNLQYLSFPVDVHTITIVMGPEKVTLLRAISRVSTLVSQEDMQLKLALPHGVKTDSSVLKRRKMDHLQQPLSHSQEVNLN